MGYSTVRILQYAGVPLHLGISRQIGQIDDGSGDDYFFCPVSTKENQGK